MKVRTSPGALVTGAILSGVLAVAAMGDGRPDDKPAAAPVATRPLQRDGALSTFKPAPGAPVAATQKPAPSQPAPPQPRSARIEGLESPDAYAPVFLRGGLTYLLVFLLAHLVLRRAEVSARWAYAGIGAASAAVAVASMTQAWGWKHLIETGMLSVYLGVVSGFGAIIGFLYVWRAGLSPEGDDPAALARALAPQGGKPQDGEPQPAATPSSAGRASAPGGRVSDDAALVGVDQTEYFGGPLQVRTSVPLMLVAALLGEGVYCIGLVVIGAASEALVKLRADLPFVSEIGGVVESKAVVLLATGLITAFPAAFLIFLTHWALRGLKRQTHLAYGSAGFLSPALLGLLAGPMGAIVGLQAAIPMAIAMTVYRSMAGVEPAPVKEDIFVRDRRNLVGADHARRQYGRVING